MGSKDAFPLEEIDRDGVSAVRRNLVNGTAPCESSPAREPDYQDTRSVYVSPAGIGDFVISSPQSLCGRV